MIFLLFFSEIIFFSFAPLYMNRLVGYSVANTIIHKFIDLIYKYAVVKKIIK